MVVPMNWGGSGCGGVWASRPSHSWTTRLRITRMGASGHSGPKMHVRAISDSRAATTRRLYSSCACASWEAIRRVPTQTPSAPKARAAATPRPSAIPPAAKTGTVTAWAIAGSRVNNAALARLCPPASLP
jgi:hypothetical protein